MPKPIIAPRFLPDLGVDLSKAEEFLDKLVSPYSRNVEFYDGKMRGRLGLQKFDPIALSGPIMLMDQYWQNDGSWDLMVATTKDLYKYDFSNTRFDILTPLYTTGTITITSGSPTIVLGSGTSWDTELQAGDFVKSGAGNVNTEQTWYEISTVDSSTQLTITSSAGSFVTDSAYVSRKCYQGASTDYWNARNFEDDNLGRIWMATNGVDLPLYYSGAISAVDLTGLPSGLTAAKYIEVYQSRVILAATVEGGINSSYRLRWSDPGDCRTWAAIDKKDFVDEDTWITGITEYDNFLAVLKESEGYVGRPISDPLYDFDFVKSDTCVGCRSNNSLWVKDDGIFYLGPDDRFHKWNLIQDAEIFGRELLPLMRESDPNTEQYVYGWAVESRNQMRWFIPHTATDYQNLCVVYDYVKDMITIWEYEQAQALSCIGEYLNTEDLYVDDPIWGEYYLDEQEGYWDDRLFLEGAPIVLYGGYDGYVRKADQSYLDDGVVYNRILRLGRDNYKLPHINKRLWKQQWWFESEASGSVTIKLKKDDSNSWETDTKTISLINATRDIIKENITWDKRAQDFQYQIEATNHFSMLGFMNWLFKKGRSF